MCHAASGVGAAACVAVRRRRQDRPFLRLWGYLLVSVTSEGVILDSFPA
jgi:hypothetical protein